MSGLALDASEEQLRELIVIAETTGYSWWLLDWATGAWQTISDSPGPDATTVGPATPERVISYFTSEELP